EIDTRQASLVVVPGDYDVDFAVWKDDLIVFGGDAGGNESYALRSIQPDGKGWRDLNESYDSLKPLEGPVGANIVSMLRSDRDWILTMGYGARLHSTGAMEVAGAFGYYRLNVRTGRRLLVEPLPGRTVTYYTDPITGQSYGRLVQDGGETVLELRVPGDKIFREAKRFPGGETPWEPVCVTPDGNHCLINVRGEEGMDRGALIEFDLRTAARTRVAFAPPRGEIDQTIRSRTGALWGVKCEAERPYFVWFDAAIGKLHASLEATFPGRTVDMIDKSMDANRILVFVHSDREPGEYFVWDARARRLFPVGGILPKIDPATMAGREPIDYRARDGLEIHGYLTRPRGGGAGPVPLVLVPHGGPFGIRDSWTFDPEAQFLASRGYAVLQVNFRGSGGYGWAFQNAGKREWGGKMQDDLTDAVRWAIERKVTRENEVGIMGGSYGGYAVLAGLVFTPELYRCGINYVGVSDLRFIAKTTRWRGRGYHLYAGNWIGGDDEDLRARSPVNFVERIRVPTLHAYGENDPRVDIQHWRVLEAALKRHDKPYEYFRESKSGHGFQDEAARLRYYRAVEDFLARNLGGR
ncbi:MAG: prolyl oligopeptidase family serine peptidase, partial [Opitutus sp.]